MQFTKSDLNFIKELVYSLWLDIIQDDKSLILLDKCVSQNIITKEDTHSIIKFVDLVKKTCPNYILPLDPLPEQIRPLVKIAHTLYLKEIEERNSYLKKTDKIIYPSKNYQDYKYHYKDEYPYDNYDLRYDDLFH